MECAAAAWCSHPVNVVRPHDVQVSEFKAGQRVAVARTSDDTAIAVTKVEAVNKGSVRVTGGLSKVWGLDGSQGSIRHRGRAPLFEADEHQTYCLRPVREGDAETAEQYEIARRLAHVEATAWHALPLATLRQIAALLGATSAGDVAPSPQPSQAALSFSTAVAKDG